MKNLVFPSLLVLCAFVVSGCDLAQPQNKGKSTPPVVQETPAAPTPPEQNVPAQAEDDTVTVAAGRGMTGKGNYGTPTANNPMEIITVPISAFFSTKERVALMQVDDAKNKFKAEHDRLPTSHEEFMTEVIQKNSIRLPRLPDGHEYIYDPSDDGTLKVRKPRNAP